MAHLHKVCEVGCSTHSFDDLEQLWSDHLASLTQNQDLNPRLNTEITDNDVVLFDTELRLNQHIAELAEARTLLSLVESRRMYGSGQVWDQDLVETLATVLEKFTEVTQSLDDLRDVLQQLLLDMRRK